jgi:hypothetical protein
MSVFLGDADFYSNIIKYHAIVQNVVLKDRTDDLQRLASGVSMLKIANEPTMFGRFIKECAFAMMFDMQPGDGVHIAKFLEIKEIDIVDVSNEAVPRRGAVFKSAAVACYCFIENYTDHKNACTSS